MARLPSEFSSSVSPGNAERLPQAPGQEDELRLRTRRGDAEYLDINLMELAVTALLGAFVAEHRPHGPHAAPRSAQESVLYRGPHEARGALRAQGQAFAVAVVEGVHLLLDDVRHLADRTPEQLGAFHHGWSNFLVSVRAKQGARVVLDVLPRANVSREDVVHPSDGLDGPAGPAGPDSVHRFGSARFENGPVRRGAQARAESRRFR